MHIVRRHEISASFNLWLGRGCKSCAVSDVLEDFHVYSMLIDLYGWSYTLEGLSFHNNQQMLNGCIGCYTCNTFPILSFPCCPVMMSPNSPWTWHLPLEYRHINTIPWRWTNGTSKPPYTIPWQQWPNLTEICRQISILSSFVDLDDVRERSSCVFPKSSNWPGPGNEVEGVIFQFFYSWLIRKSSQVHIFVASGIWYENKIRFQTKWIQP